MRPIKMRRNRRNRTVLDKKGLVEKMLEDTANTIDNIREDIEKSIVDYTFVPGKDIIETDDSVIVHVDLPGINKEDIELNVTEKRMRVKANFDITSEIEQGSYITINDQKSGVMRRTVRFPKKVIPEQADARFEQDVLVVEVPKQEKEESINVQIK
ncbi:MAG: Hsp20/alpha crystallin family protein [Methanobacterium sp.]|jgi:HSP20 family protein|nr:Hsp20/alpha crystallin family protein [Methanobacterium sp.]